MRKHFDKHNNNLRELFDKWSKPTISLLERYNKESAANFYTWAGGHRCPPLNILVDLVYETQSNIEYALGINESSIPVETAEINLRLEELLNEKGVSNFNFANKIETSSATISRYVDGKTTMRVETLLSMAEGLNVSIDYLLGLTPFRTWEDYKKITEPFIGLEPGDACVIEFPDEKLNGNVLIHADGARVVFPTGKTRSINDEIFEGVKVTKLGD